MGEHGLRKELAAFDMSYFGRAYLPHYFIRKSPHFHEELDEIWSRGVMKGRNPLKEAKVISRLKGSRQVVAAPRGHAKSTNFTFKDSLHAILYAYKHYILILSDSSEQAEQRQVDTIVSIANKQSEDIFREMMKPIFKMIDKAEDMDELQKVLKDEKKLRELYQDMESPELEDLIQQGIYLSHLIGRSMD